MRETILDTGQSAAIQLERWENAVAFNAEILESKRRRGASVLEIAQTRFNDYGPLLRLGRIAEARSLLLDCREIFEREQNTRDLGEVLAALRREDAAGPAGRHRPGTQRAPLQVPCTRGRYHRQPPTTSATTGPARRRPPAGTAHHLAAALLRGLTGIQGADVSLAAAARDLARLPDGAPPR